MQNLFPQHNGNSNWVVKCKMVFLPPAKKAFKETLPGEEQRGPSENTFYLFWDNIKELHLIFKDTFIIITLNDFRKYNLKYFELSAFTNHFTILVTEKLFGIFEKCCQRYPSNIFSIFIQISRPFPSHNTFELKPLLPHSSPISCENVLVLMRY